MIIKLLMLLLILINPKSKEIIINTEKVNREEIVIEETINNLTLTTTKIEQPIGTLKIESINLHNNLYDINSKHNNIEENITIIKASNNIKDKNSLIVLAAHSGQGKLAYFNNLNKLKINDQINLTLNNKEYVFIVTKVFEQQKNGHINISKKEISQLVLTTCSPTNKTRQLIIESIIKES